VSLFRVEVGRWSLPIALAMLSGCGGGGDYGSVGPTPAPSASPVPLVEARPYALKTPTGYRPSTPAPLVIVLHGYGSDGLNQAQYFGFLAGADKHGYLLAYPDGLIDVAGKRFWNATDACCNFYGNAVDDVAYLGAVVDDVVARYNVDPKRVYVAGHSNGGFMAHRLGCDRGDRFAAVVSLAGAVWQDASRCSALSLVNVLQVHGDADQTILYTGASAYPSAPQTVATWAEKNGCRGLLEAAGADKDLDTGIRGAETETASYEGCPPGGSVGLWTIRGGAHVPALGPAWEDEVWTYFQAHPKP
jgi:polyhydroxybutyrate depolymerase